MNIYTHIHSFYKFSSSGDSPINAGENFLVRNRGHLLWKPH